MSRSTSNGTGKPPVLVTDGEQRSALAAVRALGAAGYPVVVTTTRPRSLAGASRYAIAELQVPSSLEDPDGYRAALARIARERGVRVLIPMTEQTMLSVLAAPEAFADILIPGPTLEQFRAISDKALLLERAREVGIAVPEQHRLETKAEVAAFLDESIAFPVVLKPARSVARGDDGALLKAGVRHAADRDALRAHLEAFPEGVYPVLVQQRVIGPGVGVFLLVWEGETVATFAHRRLRENPPSGGASVYRESIVPPADLVAKSRALLDRFDWQGVAMVEYKVDAATGTPYAMEVNGRFWGSLQLAVDAGVDFPRLLVERALGQSVRGPERYPHVRSRWEWGDVNHLVARLRRTNAQLSLPPGAPGRFRAVLNFLVPWRPGDRLETLRLRDLGPFLRESADWFRGL